MLLSGVNEYKIERAFNANVLSSFCCGNQTMDDFVHQELQDYLNMGNCQLFIVKEHNCIVGMFCLDNSSLTLSESAKNNMRDGRKPHPFNAPTSADAYYWFKPTYEATEITYLAIQKERQHKGIGSFLVECIMEKVAQNVGFKGDYVIVRALNEEDYSAIPFYKKCRFTPATEERKNQNLFMYRIVRR